MGLVNDIRQKRLRQSIKILAILILLSATTSFGQIKVKGRVIDTNNEPLPGTNILVKGSIAGTIANTIGEFELNISSDSAILVFSFIGFKSYELQVYKDSVVEIKLEEDDRLISFGGKPLKLPVVNKNDCERADIKSALDFINDSFTNDSSKFNLSNETGSGFFGIDSLILCDSVFTPEDVKFIYLQLACAINFRWEQNQIRGARIIKENELNRIFKSIYRNGWFKFRKKYGECLSRFGFPVFTVSGEYCIFHWWTQCDYLAGGGNLALYKKINGKWVQVKIYASGVS